MITFPTAPQVLAGRRPTSAQCNGLVDAFNARLRSGLGDPTWRLWYKVYSIFRNIRSNDGFAFPAADEWLQLWMNCDPTVVTPDFFPQNEANPLLDFALGGNFVDGENRLNVLPVGPATTAAEAWALAKTQRGAWDPVTGAEGSPAMTAARAHLPLMWGNQMSLTSTAYTAFARKYGGVLPIVPTDGTCGVGPAVWDEDGEVWVFSGTATAYTLRFRSLRGGATLEYSSCQWSGIDQDGGVLIPADPPGYASVRLTHDAYEVLLHDGTTVTLSFADYAMEDAYTRSEDCRDPLDPSFPGYGPCTLAALRHSDAPWLMDVLQRFGSGFRGTEAERAGDDYRVKAVAFDFHAFLSRQYRLAPAVGVESGGDVTAIYPSWTQADLTSAGGEHVASGSIEAGVDYFVCGPDGTAEVTYDGSTYAANGEDYFTGVAGVTTYTSANDGVACRSETVTPIVEIPSSGNTVLTGMLVDVTTFAGELALSILSEGAVVSTFRVTAAGSRIEWFANPQGHGDLQLRLDAGTLAGNEFTVELLVQKPMKPRFQDAYVYLRLATANNGEALDSIGENVSGRAAWENYAAWGALVAADPMPAPMALEWNAVYETARRMYRERLRLMNRTQVKGYAVENDRSVLWFDRFVTVSGESIDVWEGIAPPLEATPSGGILANAQYEARGGEVIYNGITIPEGDGFFGVAGVETYGGTGEAWQIEGIQTFAPQHGLSNEWLMFISTTCYKDSEGSEWKPENYGDVVGALHNRAHFLSQKMASMAYDDAAFCAHVAWGECANPPLVNSASAHNFWNRFNENLGASEANRTKFFQSCPIYPPDYEVESVTYDEATQEVRVQFAGRFRSCISGDISRAAGPDACAGEDYRTDENAVRQYLKWVADGTPCAALIGDAAELQSPVSFSAEGSCHPRFYFTRLAPKVWVDEPEDNDTQQQSDTRMLALEMQWLAQLLDVMCEGYVDTSATASYPDCPGGRPVHFTIENLWLQIGNNERTAGLLPVSRRDDRPSGNGPFPNTRVYAEAFNRLANAVNLLTVVPVELPWEFETRQHIYAGTKPIDALQSRVPPESQPAGDSCSGTTYLRPADVCGDGAEIEEGDVGAAVSVSSWTTGMGVSAMCQARLDVDAEDGVVLECAGGAKTFRLRIDTHWAETRFAGTQTWRNALPASIADMVDMGNFSVAAALWRRDQWQVNTYPDGDVPTQDLGVISYVWANPPVSDAIGVATTTPETLEDWQCRVFSLSELTETFTLWDILRDPGYICPASFYWAMVQNSGPVGGTEVYHMESVASRAVELRFADTVVGTITVPLA